MASSRPPDMDIPPDVKAGLLHEDRGPYALGMIFSFYGLSVLFVSARIFVRSRVSKQFGLDDWLILAAELITTAMVFFMYEQIRLGDGKHLIALPLGATDRIAKIELITVSLWCPAVTLAKVSICLQYLRFFHRRKTTRFIWVLIVVSILAGVSTFVIIMTACIPLQAIWTPDLRATAKCLDHPLFWQIQSGMEVVICWSMLALLIPPLWMLNLPKSKCIGIVILLGLSSSSCIYSVLRLTTCLAAVPKSAYIVRDFTWAGILATIYAAGELLTGIICCSLPALMPLRFTLFPCWFPSRRQLAAHPPNEVRHMPRAQPLLPEPSTTALTAQAQNARSVTDSQTTVSMVSSIGSSDATMHQIPMPLDMTNTGTVQSHLATMKEEEEA